MKLFLDSSAMAKRFIDEPGSQRVEELCANASALGLSVICVPEIISALSRRKRERTLTPRQYTQIKRRLLEDVRDAALISLTPEVLRVSIAVLESSIVRGMDAIPIASAVEWYADLFVSGDQQQIRAARKAGLNTQRV
jgi:predicted nucleic acid-binding protein